MGVLDKFLDIMKLNDGDEDYDDDFFDDDYDDDFYDEEDEYFDDEEFDEKPARRSLFGKKIRRKNLLMILIWKRKRISACFLKQGDSDETSCIQKRVEIWKFVL